MVPFSSCSTVQVQGQSTVTPACSLLRRLSAGQCVSTSGSWGGPCSREELYPRSSRELYRPHWRRICSVLKSLCHSTQPERVSDTQAACRGLTTRGKPEHGGPVPRYVTVKATATREGG
ncbi:hypothetical protein Bbelb_274910 [Branchiostoma belcheri]|nr:hypothetical protein Bbelb_274910 [Branchiostoma belcheri]